MIEAFQVDSANSTGGKVRYLALPIGFDWDAFEQEQRVVPGDYSVLLAYRAGQVSQCHFPRKRSAADEAQLPLLY